MTAAGYKRDVKRSLTGEEVAGVITEKTQLDIEFSPLQEKRDETKISPTLLLEHKYQPPASVAGLQSNMPSLAEKTTLPSVRS